MEVTIMDTDPKQYMHDPATGELVEARWVCPSCKFVNGAVPRCCYPPCGWMRPTPPSVSDDTGEFEPLSIIDPPGGEAGH